MGMVNKAETLAIHKWADGCRVTPHSNAGQRLLYHDCLLEKAATLPVSAWTTDPMQQYIKSDLLDAMPWRWMLWWLLAPNMAVIAMWPIGGPSMTATILMTGLFGLIAAQRSLRKVRIVAIGAIFAFVSAVYVTKSFNIDLLNAFRLHQYIGELDVFKSPEYLVAATAMGGALIGAVSFGSARTQFNSRSQYLTGLAAIGVLIAGDMYFTAGTRGSYKATAPAGTPMDSAILRNDIRPENLMARNLIIIMVESWGVPEHPLDKRIDRQIWDASKLTGYDATYGISEYYGSTTNAELRELCGVWSDHNAFDFDNSNCLPRQFAEKGFKTMAFHSFESSFFWRWQWYPKLGFQSDEFKPELGAMGARDCNGVFAGVCDEDVPKLLGDRLRASPSERNLIYWLTVNAHLPVGSDEALGTDRCSLGTARWRTDFPMLCRSYAVHKSVADAIFEEIDAPDFPEADILIVGDHMPPFFQRAIRKRFDSAHVPWLYLQNRAARQRATSKPVRNGVS